MSRIGKQVIAIDGLIGCGKTTLLNFIKDKDDSGVEVVLEDVDTWRNFQGHNMLDELYSTANSALPTQILIQLTNLWNLLIAKESDALEIYCERSLEISPQIFISQLHGDNRLNAIETKVASHFNQFQTFCIRSNLIVYLKTVVEVCMDRMTRRDRKEEKNVTRGYMQYMERRLDEMFSCCFFGGETVVFDRVAYNNVLDVYMVCIDGNRNTEDVFESLIGAVAEYKTRRISDVAEITEKCSSEIPSGKLGKNASFYSGIVNATKSGAAPSNFVVDSMEQAKLRRMHTTSGRKNEVTTSLYGRQVWSMARP